MIRSSRTIGEALRASYVLEGSVPSNEEQVRIIARLVETATEAAVRSDCYDYQLRTPIARAVAGMSVQADIAGRLVRAVALQIAASTTDPMS